MVLKILDELNKITEQIDVYLSTSAVERTIQTKEQSIKNVRGLLQNINSVNKIWSPDEMEVFAYNFAQTGDSISAIFVDTLFSPFFYSAKSTFDEIKLVLEDVVIERSDSDTIQNAIDLYNTAMKLDLYGIASYKDLILDQKEEKDIFDNFDKITGKYKGVTFYTKTSAIEKIHESVKRVSQNRLALNKKYIRILDKMKEAKKEIAGGPKDILFISDINGMLTLKSATKQAGKSSLTFDDVTTKLDERITTIEQIKNNLDADAIDSISKRTQLSSQVFADNIVTLKNGGFNNEITTLTLDLNGNLYIAGLFTSLTTFENYVAQYSSNNTWSSLDISTYNSNITTLCVDSNNNLYGAGIIANSINQYCVAKYNISTSSWDDVFIGPDLFNGEITQLVFDSNNNLYAAGLFVDAPTTDATNLYSVVKYNNLNKSWEHLGVNKNNTDKDGLNKSWVTLGSLGFNGPITTLAVDSNDNLYAAGQFTDSNGNYYVAQYSTTNNTWSSLGSQTFNGEITTLVVESKNLYAAGQFTDSNGNYYVAKCSTTTNKWSSLDSQTFNGPITTLVVDSNNNLYAAGQFTDLIFNIYYVAQYSSTNNAWTSLDSQTFNGPITTLAVDSNNNLYAAGQFTDPISGNYYVAQYSTTNNTWTSLIS